VYSHFIVRLFLAAQSLSLFLSMFAWWRARQRLVPSRVTAAAFCAAVSAGIGGVAIALLLMATTSG
jgi:hypothetical protein